MRRDFLALVSNEGIRRHCEGLSYSAWRPEVLWRPLDPYSMGIHKFHLESKRPEPEVDNSPSVSVKECMEFTPLAHVTFISSQG